MKPLFWIGSSRRDLKDFPDEVQDEMGWALRDAQFGGRRLNVKVLSGFAGAGVLEVVEHDHGDAYRAVYTVRFEGAVYVLDAFQKKSKRGIATPRLDREIIEVRLSAAERHYRSLSAGDTHA